MTCSTGYCSCMAKDAEIASLRAQLAQSEDGAAQFVEAWEGTISKLEVDNSVLRAEVERLRAALEDAHAALRAVGVEVPDAE